MEIHDSARQLAKTLLTKVATWRSGWEDVSKYVIPRLQQSQQQAPGTHLLSKPDEKPIAELFDTTGVLALNINAGGVLAWMTPRQERWFAFTVPPELDEDEDAKFWLNSATDIAYRHITSSNLFTALFELNVCRSAFGTACLSRAWDPVKRRLVFSSERRFACAESSPDGVADTVVVEKTLTAQMALGMFGEDKLAPAIAKIAKDPAKRLEASEYQHLIFPNPDYVEGSILATQRRYRSIYIHASDGHICSDSGLDQSPYLITRYLKWSSDPSAPYGFSPAIQTLPDLKQCNRMEQLRDVAVEVSLNPPIIVPAGWKGRVDFRPRGQTSLGQDGRKPELWDYQPRTIEVSNSLEEKRKRINDAFHVPLFAMFQQLEREMTATEVQARLGEKLDNISPTLGLYHDELLAPLVEWIFVTLLEAGEFGFDVPPNLQLVAPDGQSVGVPVPRVEFSNRLAIAIQATKDAAALRALERLAGFLQVQPELLDNFNTQEISREFFASTGADPKRLRPLSEVETMREQRAFQQAQVLAAAEVQSQEQ